MAIEAQMLKHIYQPLLCVTLQLSFLAWWVILLFSEACSLFAD
jgi:hypothetical protein